MPKREIKSIKNVLKKNYKELEVFNKVKQTGIGYKTKDGKIIEDTLAALFYVRYKPNMNILRNLNIEPIPKEIEGIPTDVVEVPTGFDKRILRISPRMVAADDFTYRPLSGGIAMINANAFPSGTGTLGLLLQKKRSNEIFGCTNNHIGANEDLEDYQPTANVGDPWIQPGAHGNGRYPRDAIGYLYNWNKIKSYGTGINYYDFALGKIEEPRIYPYEMIEVGRIEESEEIEFEDIVIKRGRTTQKTLGKVTAVDVRTYLPYQGVPCWFEDQVQITGLPPEVPFSTNGDSGAFVVSAEAPHKVKCQLFAGGIDDFGIDRTIASPIKRIINEFNLDL